MNRSSMLSDSTLETLVRTVLMNRELSPGVAAEIDRYRLSTSLTPEAQRYLAILDDALADGSITVVTVQTNYSDVSLVQ